MESVTTPNQEKDLRSLEQQNIDGNSSMPIYQMRGEGEAKS